MDMTNAFDHVKHSVLFKKLIGRGVPAIYIRLLLNMYRKQEYNVKWNNVTSSKFSSKNGVKQDAVLSPFLFCIYIDELFTILRKRKTGCWENGSFVGILGYADDLVLLSPSRHDKNVCRICHPS